MLSTGISSASLVLLGAVLQLLAFASGRSEAAMSSKERMSLEQIYLEYNESYFADRFLEYAWHYEAHLPLPSRNEPIHIMEIGVQSGGSARIWRQWWRESALHGRRHQPVGGTGGFAAREHCHRDWRSVQRHLPAARVCDTWTIRCCN